MWTITVDLCFEVAEYPEAEVGEKAAKVGGFESQACWELDGSVEDVNEFGLDIDDIQGVSR